MRSPTKTEPANLPAINLAEPESMLSLPDWLKSLFSAVSLNPIGQPDWSRTPQIHGSLMPTGPQRTAMERRCDELERATQAGPEKQSFLAVSRLLGFYANGQSSPEQTKLKATVYLDVLRDLPGWAVSEAVRRWFHGDRATYPTATSFEFVPSPALIRQAAEEIAKVARGQQVLIKRVLAATPLVEVSPEERERVGARVETVLKTAVAGMKAAPGRSNETDDEARARRARVHAETAKRKEGKAA